MNIYRVIRKFNNKVWGVINNIDLYQKKFVSADRERSIIHELEQMWSN